MKLYMCEVFLKLYVFSGIQRFWRWEHREAGSIERQPKHVVGSGLFLGFVDTKKNKDPQRPHYVLLFLLGSLTSPPHPPLNLLFSASFTIFKRLSTSPVSVRSCGAHFLSFFVFFYSLVFRIRGPLQIKGLCLVDGSWLLGGFKSSRCLVNPLVSLSCHMSINSILC